MPQPQKKLTKSKKWIDYSSEQENQHHDDEKTKKQHQVAHHPKSQSNSLNHPKKQSPQNLPLLSTSHEPVNAHYLQDKKDLLDQLRKIKASTVWVVLSITDQKNSTYLKQTIDNLKNQKNTQILNIYSSRENKNAFDLRIDYDLCQKWILEGFDKNKLIRLQLRKKPQQKRQHQKYQQKDRDLRPVRQYAPQHTTSTRYQPKHIQYKEKQTYQSPKQYYGNNFSKKPTNTYPQKKKYIEKNPLAEQIEQKVEQELQERKLQKKDKTKKPERSNIFSKNPYDAFNESD